MFKYLILLAYFLFAYATAAEVLPQHIINKLDAQLEINKQRYGVVSQSVLIQKNGQIIYQGLNGNANIELQVPIQAASLYPTYSIAKLFASVLLMQQVEKGNIDLDLSIGHYLPHLPKQWQDITVRHCLNHTSGLPEYLSMEVIKQGFLKDKNGVFNALANQPFQFETGSKYNYNNTNYLIISSIIEKQMANNYLAVVNEKIIQPLGLSNTTYASALKVQPNMVTSYRGNNGVRTIDRGVDWPEYTFAHSGLYSTTQDMATFINAITQGKLLKPKTLTAMWQPMKLKNKTLSKYASGWEYSHNDNFIEVGHDGGDRVRLQHYFNEQSKDRYTLVYLTNGNSRNTWTALLGDSVMAIVSPKEFPLSHINMSLINAAYTKATPDELDRMAENLTKAPSTIRSGTDNVIVWAGWSLFTSAGGDIALPLFELNRRLHPKSAHSWGSLAYVYRATGDDKAALDNYKKALSLAPENEYLKHQIAQLTH